MPVSRNATLLATALCLVLGSAAFAQVTTTPPDTTTPPAPTADQPAAEGEAPVADALSMGTDANAAAKANDGIGSTYVASTHGDWEQRCVRTEDGADPCQLYQLLQDSEGNSVAEITIFGLPTGQKAYAGATIIVPLETLLTSDLTLQIDSSTPRKYPFSWCSSIGCIARLGFTEAEVSAFRKGNKALISIVPVVAPDKKVTVEASLKGFTAGYDAVNKANGN